MRKLQLLHQCCYLLLRASNLIDIFLGMFQKQAKWKANHDNKKIRKMKK